MKLTEQGVCILKTLWRLAVCGGLAALVFFAVQELPSLLPDRERIASLIVSAAVNPLPERPIEAQAEPLDLACIPAEPELPIADAFYDELFRKQQEKEALFSVPDGAQLIRSVDLSSPPGNVINQTDYDPPSADTLPVSAAPHALTAGGDPVLLVIHTHGTESFSDNGTYYTADTATRSSDPTQNMVAVGDAFCDRLTALGVPLLHCRTPFDEESYNDSYTLSGKAVADTLEQYPSIRYVLDLHRDSILFSDGTKARPLSDSGRAQIMFVVGSDRGGALHPNWRDNYALALRLTSYLYERDPTVCRAVNLRTASFNQQLSSGFLLVEMGACGNTLEEVKASALLLAEAFAAHLGIEVPFPPATDK